MKRRWVVALHLAYWFAYVALLSGVLLIVATDRQRPALTVLATLAASPVSVVTVLPNLLSFYFAYWVLFPRFLLPRRAVGLGVGAVVGAVVSAAVGLVVASLVGQAGRRLVPWGAELAGLVTVLAVIALLHIAVALVIRGFVAWYATAKAKEELQAKTHAMELELVRSKFDPHFLFNSINNIDVLIARDPVAASSYLNKLADLLRFALHETGQGSILLSQELAYLDKYVALEQLRSANPRGVSIETSGQTGGLMIAPMTLVPYVENAFKHAPVRREDGTITIRIAVEGRRLRFLCQNRIAPGNGTEARGLGNDLIARRLALLYPDRHRVAIAEQDGVYSVSLEVDCG